MCLHVCISLCECRQLCAPVLHKRLTYPGSSPLFENVSIFRAVSKGQLLYWLGKKNLKRFNRKNTHPLGNRHRFVTVTCSMLCIPLNNALLRHCVMLFWLLVQPVGCLLFTMTCIRTCLYLVKFTLFSFRCPESSLCLHRLYSKKTSKRPKRLLLNQPLSHSGV